MNVPILFLHGFPLNSSSWKAQIEYFSDKRIVFAPDLRGHGSGPKGGGPWMIPDFTSDLHLLLVEAKINKIIICGLSMGGYVALDFVHQHPEMVQALVLCATQSAADSNEAKDKRYKTLEKIRNDGLNGFADDFSDLALSETKTEFSRELKRSIEDIIKSNNPADIALVVGCLASRKDSTPMLHEIKCPTLVIAGVDDRIISLEVGQAMASKIPDCKFAKIPDAGHLLNQEQPERFNSVLEFFLNNLK